MEPLIPTSAAAAANDLLHLSWADRTVPPCDQLKLQKLLYYAHAWHLAIRDLPLFSEDIEAWRWGPVVRNIYYEFQGFRRRAIDKEATELLRTGESVVDYEFLVPRITNHATKEFVRSVWNVHKGYTGIQLTNATHGSGEPWTIVKEKYGTLDHKPTIPNDLISDIFKKKIEVRAQNNST
jgi:uncharacterized phage-associated protein